jgi:hypothetical protein
MTATDRYPDGWWEGPCEGCGEPATGAWCEVPTCDACLVRCVELDAGPGDGMAVIMPNGEIRVAMAWSQDSPEQRRN